MMTDSNILEGK